MRVLHLLEEDVTKVISDSICAELFLVFIAAERCKVDEHVENAFNDCFCVRLILMAGAQVGMIHDLRHQGGQFRDKALGDEKRGNVLGRKSLAVVCPWFLFIFRLATA